MLRDYVPAWLGNAIERKIGDRYLVDSEPEFLRDPDVRGALDILIWRRGQSYDVTAVLVEHVPEGFDLPLLTAEITQRIIEENSHLNLHLIVATMNIVCSELRAALKRQGVAVVCGGTIKALSEGIVQAVAELDCERVQAFQ